MENHRKASTIGLPKASNLHLPVHKILMMEWQAKVNMDTIGDNFSKRRGRVGASRSKQWRRRELHREQWRPRSLIRKDFGHPLPLLGDGFYGLDVIITREVDPRSGVFSP